jgi:hypothetical protein
MKPARSHSASLSWIACGRCLRRAAGATTTLCALLLAPVVVAQNGAADADEPAIPPGQEELLADMLGQGATLPECDLVDGQANYTTITATYACPNGEVVFTLAHRSQGGRSATPTERFAITLQSGSPPHGFADALVSRVRSREGDFEWKWPTKGDDETGDVDTHSDRRPQ